MTKGHNRLPALASAIKQAHEDATQASQRAFEHAREAGKMLIEVKEAVPHGQWLPWLKNNVSMSKRTAQAYMKLANLDDAKAQRVAHLSIREALKKLSARTVEHHTTKINRMQFPKIKISQGFSPYPLMGGKHYF